jgi:HD-GYP domain-containing protein (c-di-GMP phosphodiesterase class II)
MKLALPVLHRERPDTLLLRAGFVLDERALARLRDMRLPELWIEYPALSFIEKHISPQIVAARGGLQSGLNTLFTRLNKNASANLDYGDYKRTMHDFVQKLLDEPDAALFITEMSNGNQPLMRHSADVSFLSLLMGLKLDAYLINQRRRLKAHRAKDVVGLGVAALLHDIGMLFIDEDAADHFFETNDESDPAFRQHVKLGYEKLQTGLDPAAANAVLNHHQHFDGSGFPRRRQPDGKLTGLEGEQIHIFSRILCVADLYDRVRNPPGAVHPVPAVVALNHLRTPPESHWIDPMVFKALLAVAPAYPPGAVVTLSNGQRCAVVGWSPRDPCRPTVQVIGDLTSDTGWRDQPVKRYALSERRDLTVAEVDGVPTEEHNFYPSHSLEFHLELERRDQVEANDRAAA